MPTRSRSGGLHKGNLFDTNIPATSIDKDIFTDQEVLSSIANDDLILLLDVSEDPDTIKYMTREDFTDGLLGDFITITDNESTNENDLIPFIANAATTTGSQSLEMDGDFHYNPSTGRITATQLAGTLQTASQTNITGVGTITTGTWQATDIGVAHGGTGASSLTANAILTGNGTSAIQAETDLLFDSNKIIPTAAAHDATGTALSISAGATTAGTSNNQAGGALTFQGGRGKGSGAGGAIIFQTANAGGSGSSLNALVTALTINDDGSLTTSGTIELGHASDTTIARSGSGDITIEGNAVYRAGGTDVAVADGGTGASTLNNLITMGTHTTGNYVATITAGTGLTSDGATSGESITHSLSVDASQTQITSVGALNAGSITSGFTSIDVGSGGITTTGAIAGGTIDASTDFTIGDTVITNGVITDTSGLSLAAATTITGALTVGLDDTGHDVKFFGASAGAFMMYDQSEDQLVIMGASADATTSTGKLLLATSLADVNANDVIGKIDFQAPSETGTDAITIAASIQAIAQGTFSASVNATDLIFYTGHSEAATEKFRFTSQGELGIGGATYGSSGDVLTSGGAGAAPTWETPTTGDITGITTGDGLSGGATSGTPTLAVDLVSNGGLEFSSGELRVATGISQYDVAQFAASVADDDFLRIDGTSVEGLSAAEVAAAIEGSIDAVGTIASGTWQATDIAVAHGGTGASSLTANGVLIGNGTSAVTAVDMSTKGGILAGDGSGNPSVLAVGGSDGHVLTVDSSEATGLKYAAVSAGAATSLAATSASANEPIVSITNTHADATAGFLKFVKNPASGQGADNDIMGTITFHGTDAGNNAPEELARMEAYVIEADHGSEAGGIKFYVAENDATMTAGLQILGVKDADGEIDVTIGAGAASTTIIAGTLTMGSTAAMTNAGLVSVANQSNITGLGTISSGTWEATDVAVAHGGTGASSAGDARTNLGVGPVAGSSSIVTTGALNAGSVTSGFGAIDNGTSGIRTNTFTAETSIVPDAVGGADIGSTSAEWGDVYIADDKKIYLGDGQDVSLEYDEDGTDQLRIAGNTVFANQVESTLDIMIDSTPADETVSGVTATFTAGEDLVRGEVVYFKASDSKMHKAVATAAATSRCVAMAAADISADAAGLFLLQGFLADNGSFPSYTIGGALYTPEAETSSQNVPEQTAPDTDGDFVQVIGWAMTANSVYFNPSNDIIEHA